MIRQMALAPSLSVLIFHTLRWRAKTPGEQTPRGFNVLVFYRSAVITKADGQQAFPSVTAQKTASFSLSFRPQSHKELARESDRGCLKPMANAIAKKYAYGASADKFRAKNHSGNVPVAGWCFAERPHHPARQSGFLDSRLCQVCRRTVRKRP